MLTEKPLTKTDSLVSQKYHRNPVLRLTMKSSIYIDYCWLINRWWKLGPWTQKSSKKPNSTDDADIFCAHTLLLFVKLLTKTEPYCPKNHPRNPILRPTLKSSLYLDCCCLTNHWQKLGPRWPKNLPRSPVLRLMLTSSAHIDYCWLRNRWQKPSPAIPKIILETQFYGWRWNLHSTWTAAASQIIDKNWVPGDPKLFQETQFYGWRWHLLRG
jgi:hypothetical protein